MSTGFYILISPGDSVTSKPVEAYELILRLVLASSTVKRAGLKLTIYRGQRPFTYGSRSTDRHLAFEEKFRGDITPEELIEVVNRVHEEDVYVSVSCAYERLRWNNETCDCEPSAGWLNIEYESSSFDRGQGYKRLGPYRIYFDNRNYFTPLLVDLSKCPATNPTALSKLVEYGKNIKFAENLFKELAVTIEPQHLILVTEGSRVNPVNFHMVYHSQASGFLFDVQRILQLHGHGGGYFYDGRAGDFDVPYCSLRAQGLPYEDSIRSAERAHRLAQQLDCFSAVLGGTNINGIRLADEEIFEMLTSCNDIEAELIENGIYAVSSNFLFGYLDVLYERILDRLVSKTIGDA